jgi:hypothetical protein
MIILDVLNNNYADKEWVLVGNNYEGLDWLDESPKPTEQELIEHWNNIQLEADAKVATRTSALAKLSALGLTPEEIASL